MLDTRSISATSATVRNAGRARFSAMVESPLLRKAEGTPPGPRVKSGAVVVSARSPEFGRPGRRGGHRLEEGGPGAGRLEGPEPGGGGAAGRGDLGPQGLGAVARLGQEPPCARDGG